MSKIILAAAFAVLFAGMPAHAQTMVRQDEQSRIMSLEKAWNQAIAQKDSQAISALMADELMFVNYDGRLMNKSEYLVSMHEDDAHFNQITSDSMQVKFYGKSAVVVGTYREKGIRNGKPFLRRERFLDTWIYRNGMWVCVTSESTLIAK